MEKMMQNRCGKAGTGFLVALLTALAVPALAVEYTPNSAAYRQAMNASSVNWTGKANDYRHYNTGNGEMFASLMGASVAVQREFRRALPSIYNYSQTAHMQNQSDAGFDSEAGPASAVAPSCPTSMCAPNNNWVMWDTPWMTSETWESKDGYLGLEQKSSGFATGISRLLGDTTAIGVAIGYDYRKFDSRDSYYWRERADAFHAALYGGTAIGCFFVDGYAGYTRTWHRTERFTEFNNNPADYDRNKGNFNDTILSAGLKASYVWILPNDMRITPSAGLDYSYISLGGVNETGWRDGAGGASTSALRVDRASHSFVQMPLMVSANKTFYSDFLTFKDAQSLWTPEVRAGYVPQFGSGRSDVKARYINGTTPSFKSSSTEIDDYGTVGAGMKLKLADKYIFSIDYNYYFGDKYSNHSLTAAYGVSF